MTDAIASGPRTVRRALASALCGALALVALDSAMAQADVETLADFRACGALERDSARLACFDGVLAAHRESTESDEIADSGPLDEPVPAQTEPQSPPTTLPAATQDASETPDETVETQAASVAAARSLETAPAREARTARSESAEVPTVMIVEMNTRIPGAARFITDDGRVFLQTSGGGNYRNYPDVPFEAALEDGALDSTFLRLGPRLRVRVISND